MLDSCNAATMFGKKRTYLDHAASTPQSAAALKAHAEALTLVGNPSSPHAEGRAAKDSLEASRSKVARLMSVKADDVIFTSGATEGNAIAICGAVMKRRAEREGALVHVLYLPSCHASVVETIRALSKFGVEAEALSIRDGLVDIESLKRQLRANTALVAMDMVCGETGTLWNTKEVALALRGTGTILLADASQAPLTELMERTRIAADMITLDAQKIGGVRGTGVLIVPRMLSLEPLLHGGGQERGLRPGTENIAGAAAFATALADAQNAREMRGVEWEKMRIRLVERIAKEIPDALVNVGKKHASRILNISLPGRDTDYLVALLDEAGFAISTKSACETDSSEGSRAVMALTGDAERAKSTLRISWGPDISPGDLARFASALRKAVAFLDSSL